MCRLLDIFVSKAIVVNTPRILKIQYFIAVLLAVGIPFAGRFQPYTVMMESGNGVMAGSVSDDPHYIFRIICISLGMTFALVSIALSVVSLFRKECSVGQRLLMLVLSLLIFNIGWRLFPFYANGLMQVFGNGGSSSAFDPKDLFPNNTFRFVWPLVVVLFYLFLVFIIPLLIIVHLLISYTKRVAGKTEVMMVIIYLLNYAFIWLTPQYLYWFFD